MVKIATFAKPETVSSKPLNKRTKQLTLSHTAQIIKNLAEEFTSQTFGTEIPEGYCFLTCFPFSILLDIKNIKHSIICGTTSKNDSLVAHIWLYVNQEGTIIDPTIRQFDHTMEAVYVGKLEENEITKQFKPGQDSFNEWFPNAYEIWTEPLVDKNPRTFTRPAGFEDKMNLINIRTASVLYSHIDIMPLKEEFMQENKCNNYFSPIFKFLREKSSTDKAFVDQLSKSMPYGFDALLLRALNTN